MRATNLAIILIAPLCLASCSATSDTVQRSISSAEPLELDTAWILPGPASNLGDVDQILELASGELLVVDRSAKSIKRFTSGGQFLGELVTDGSGPRQAAQPYALSVDSDTLFLTARDPFTRTVSWVNLRDSSSGRSAFQPSTVTPLACFANARCLVRNGTSWSRGALLSRAGESHRDSLELGWMYRDTTAANPNISWFALLEGPLVVAFEWPSGPLPTGTVGHEMSPGALLAVSAAELWTLGEPERRLYTWPLGSTQRVEMRLPRADVAVDSQAIDDSTEVRAALARTPLLKNRVRASRDISYIRDRGLPYASRLVPGRAGRVWVQLYADGARRVQHYLSASPSGLSARRIAVPGDISVLFVGDSLIFGAVASDTSNTGLIALRQRGATSNTGDAKM